jgi:hypothetical protein
MRNAAVDRGGRATLGAIRFVQVGEEFWLGGGEQETRVDQ